MQQRTTELQTMNWLQKLSQEEEHIADAAIYINGKFYFGEHHGIAFNKALAEGAITYDEDGNIEGYPGPDIHLDLLRTNKGRIMDRFQSSREFNFSGF